jgi:hypothetical protein
MAQKRYAFVIRLWNEAPEGPANRPIQMRGSLQLAHVDQLIYFDSIDKIPDLLRQLTGWEPDDVKDEQSIQ